MRETFTADQRARLASGTPIIGTGGVRWTDMVAAARRLAA